MWNRAGSCILIIFCGLCGLSLLCLAGCIRPENSHFCPGRNANNNCDEPPAPSSCTSNDQCSEPTPVCDVTGSMACVPCTPDQPGACSGVTPTCDEDRTCRACRTHVDCAASNTCLPDGSCADPAQVAYVRPTSLGGTVNTICSLQRPCTMVTHALVTGRAFVKLAGTTDEAVTVQGGRTVTFLAEPDAKLTRTSCAGAILTVLGSGTSLTIYDLSISNAPNDPSGIGIVIPPGSGAPTLSLIRSKVMSNSGGGISVAGGMLTVSQSTISGNTGGGIFVMNGTFVIVDNVFFNNGNDTQTVGGVAINTPQNAVNRLEFNSFSLNKAMAGKGTALDCHAGVFTAQNNIISQNGTVLNMEQVRGTCEHAYSIVHPGTPPSGTGNSNMDPLFVDITTGDLHVKARSPALGAAAPASDLTGPAEFDIDGQKRTRPADIGADEVP